MDIMGFTLFRIPRYYSPQQRSFASLQILSILIVLAITILLSHRAGGYVLEGVSWPSGSVVTFQMGLGSAGRTLIDGNTSWDVAASPGLTAWDNVVARLQYTSNVAGTSASSGDHINSVVFSTTIFGQKFGTGTLAVTYYRSMGSSIVEADVLFNKNQQFDSYRGPLRYGTSGWAIGDIRRVFIHELGHALGLDHPDQHGQHVDAIMNSVTSNRETLSADDTAGAQSMYGAPTPTPTPTPNPSGSHFGNISTRMNVGSGNNVMIAGFMQKLQGEYTGKGVVWLSIDSSAPGLEGNLTAEQAQKVMKDWSTKQTALLLDPEGKAGRAYNARNTPHMG